MSRRELIKSFVVAALQLALVAALAGAGWLVYRRLPEGAGEGARATPASATALRIVLRGGGAPDAGAAAASGVAVQLYPIDVAAARREFEDERRYGQRFEDFVVRRMGARQPIPARLGPGGEATVSVPHGRWWVHATLEGPLEVSWRLPVNVAGREQTVELSESNAFTRTKSF